MTHAAAFIVWIALVAFVSDAQDATSGNARKPQMMPANVDPDWEVVTVRPGDPYAKSDRIHLRGNHVTLENETVESLVMSSYNLQKNQIAGVQEWVREERWTVDGLADADGEPNAKQLQAMVRKVLSARFELQLHHEQREMPVYALTVIKGGPRLTANPSDPDGLMDQENHGGNGWRMDTFKNTSMTDLVSFLRFRVDRPIVDQTGLKGRYDLQLKWTPNEIEATTPDAPPGLFTAIQEQLGLKLEPTRAPAEVLVIDKVEKPGAN